MWPHPTDLKRWYKSIFAARASEEVGTWEHRDLLHTQQGITEGGMGSYLVCHGRPILPQSLQQPYLFQQDFVD